MPATELATRSRNNLHTLRAFDTAFAALSPAAQVKYDLAVAHRWAERWRWHEGVINHFTALAPGFRDRFFAIPYGIHWSEVEPGDFITVDLDGRVLEGEGEIELTSLLIHAAMHRELPQAEVVLHTHQPNITALTCLEDQTLALCSQHATHFIGRVAYLNAYGLAIEESIGGLINQAIGDKDILLMANHGVTVCGPTVSIAFDDLYALDRACEVQLLAQATQKKLREIPAGEAAELGAQARPKIIEEGDQHFRALRRLLWKEAPHLLTGGYSDQT